MKIYKDNDSYVYNKSLFDKKIFDKKKCKDFLIRLESALLVFNIVFSSGVIANNINYSFKRINPFDGQSISSSDFTTNYKVFKSRSFLEDESIKETIEYIKNADIDEKKAYLLYYALLSNETLSSKEKLSLKNAIKYFCDNEYVDYEYIYNQFLKIQIIEKNAKFPNTTISSTCTKEFTKNENVFSTKIKLGDEDDLFHEFVMHGASKNYSCSWIEEGFASIIDAEYNNGITTNYKGNIDVYPVETNVIRFLCELMGKEKGRECFFKIAAGKLDGKENALDLLSCYLQEIGIPDYLIQKLYAKMDEFSSYRGKNLDFLEYIEVSEIRKAITGILSKMYYESIYVNKYDESINSLYLSRIIDSSYTYLSSDKFYYFNYEKMNEFPVNETIRYFYPEELSDEIIEKKKEDLKKVLKENNDFLNYISSGRYIDEKYYLLINENELGLCDKTKIIEYKEVYMGDHSYEYVKNNENKKWDYVTAYEKDKVENYLVYYNYFNKKSK